MNTSFDSININSIVYFQLNIQLQVNSHQSQLFAIKGKTRMTHIQDHAQDKYLICSSWPSMTSIIQSDLVIKFALKNRLMLKILGISNDLNDILDELDTILDDPYARYLS